MKTKKINILRGLTLTILASSLLIAGCVPPDQPATNANGSVGQINANADVVTNAAANASNGAPNSITPPKQSSARLPVTLPVLDAMFYDEGFAEELKSKLQLTDEQIEKLKNSSGEAVAGLGESGDGNTAGSTRAATRRAEEQIRGILGDEKSNQLFELVQNRWAAGNLSAETAPPTKPNAIPTDTRIVVNAPAYRMDVFQDGKLLKTYKIGIGYPEFPLPNGLRKAQSIIFNPTWTPPDEPWVKGKVKPGRKVEAGSKLNPLGPIKIPIGLPSLIHGGKQAARLGGFASHGCVGLTDSQVQDFSLVLAQISGTELSAEDVKNYEKQKTETKNVKLSAPIPVELRYETIVVENGKLKIFRDVYEQGTNTEENLRKVLETYGVDLDDLNEADRQKILASLTEMNKDAGGNPITGSAATNAGNSNSSNSKANSNNNSDGKVTRNIKGKKETEIVLAELSGKGYPAAVAANEKKAAGALNKK